VKEGLTEDDALLQARLARILRADEYDFKAKRPILWEPTKLSPH
jgi:DNA polymerase I